MNIRVQLDSSCIEISQEDIEDMWDYLLQQNTVDFIYQLISSISELDIEDYKEEFRLLYEKLKDFFENE